MTPGDLGGVMFPTTARGSTGSSLEMNRLSLWTYRLKFEALGELLFNSEESMDIYLEWIKQNRKMSTCNRLDLESIGSWSTMLKNFSGIAPNTIHMNHCSFSHYPL